ncbi:MAG: TIGR03862 family flavoprotein [Bacteroidetes bacterium]|nr:TIGR03862 family flavoprotein [Bacteroidota bacterium]
MKKTISIIGGGASALILACELDPKIFSVSIFEKNNALGRKFLVAGDGGLNLTHSENEGEFVLRYTPNEFLRQAFSHFSNKKFIEWINALGIETFVGTSGRLFPKKGIKPIDVLKRFEEKIKKNNVILNFKHEWKGFENNNELIFKTAEGNKVIKSDIVIFCLGGASWPVTGSKGDWRSLFEIKSVKTNSFQASNCSFKVDWPKNIINDIEGKPLKNISITCGDKMHAGEIVLTTFGIEGSGVYPLSSQIREQIKENEIAKIIIDLKPLLSKEDCLNKLFNLDPKLSYTENSAKNLNLNKTQIVLLKSKMSKNDFLDPVKFVNNLKALEIHISALGSIEDAISSVGGISLNQITENFELKKIKNNYVIGEMLDYDAPTGGYLLQSCFSMGKYLADHLNEIAK